MATLQRFKTARFEYPAGQPSPTVHLLAVPLQEVRPAKSIWVGRSVTLDRKTVEVVEVGTGVDQVIGDIRYDDEPQGVIDLMTAGWRGIELRYIPDFAGAPTEFHDCIYMGPDPGRPVDFDVFQKVFDEHRITIILQRTDSGSFSQVPNIF